MAVGRPRPSTRFWWRHSGPGPIGRSTATSAGRGSSSRHQDVAGLGDLAAEYQLGIVSNDFGFFEVIAPTVAIVDFGSPISGTRAEITIKVALGLDVEAVRVGYQVLLQGRVIERVSLPGSAFTWQRMDRIQQGVYILNISPGALLNCAISYSGIAQNFGWLVDPATALNPRRAIYAGYDSKLELLRDLLSKQGRGRDARELETGVAWLLWMLGFSVMHLGGTPRTQDAVDLIAATPAGHFAVIECTTGQLRADGKMALLIERAESVRRQLAASSYTNVRVMTVMITSRSSSEIVADSDRHGRDKGAASRHDGSEPEIRPALRCAGDRRLSEYQAAASTPPNRQGQNAGVSDGWRHLRASIHIDAVAR